MESKKQMDKHNRVIDEINRWLSEGWWEERNGRAITRCRFPVTKQMSHGDGGEGEVMSLVTDGNWTCNGDRFCKSKGTERRT